MARTSTARTARTRKSAPKKTAARKTAKTARKKTAVPARTKKAAAKKAAPKRKTTRSAAARMLSKTTVRAKWIENVDQHEDRPGQSLATRSHEVIQQWAEERGAQPATVPGTEHEGRPGVLRFNFPGFGGENLEIISWDDWFKPFDERNLVFVYQEHLKNGNQSNFFRLDNPEREEA